MTQIIWRSTTSVGCWATTCPSLGDLSLLFCAYWPAGNYIGEFQDNVPKKSVASNAHVASVPREVHMKSTSQPSSKSSSHKGTVGHKLPVLSNTLIHDIKEAAGTFKQPPEPVSAHDELFAPMMLEMHNQLRALHPNTSPLRYNFTLAAYAKQHTDKCKYEHSDSPYGESIGQEDNQPLGMVNWWYVGEVKKFDFAHGGFSEETVRLLIYDDHRLMDQGPYDTDSLEGNNGSRMLEFALSEFRWCLQTLCSLRVLALCRVRDPRISQERYSSEDQVV